jgi:two-component system CheB/CheR fusion protein
MPDQEKNVQIRVRLLPGKRGQEKLAAIFFEEISTRPKNEENGELHVYDLNQEAEQRIRDLEQELQFTKENLQATIEELETSNEELQATNEELLASNEELQSTNEELQSVNEELHTVNAEYQSKIIELTELNNDLDNLISSTRMGALFLDENLDIRKFTSEMKQVFRILETDIGRPFHYLSHDLINVDLLDLIRKVEKDCNELEMEVCTQNGMWYLLRIMPYQIGAGFVSGFLLTLIDINILKKTQSALTKSNNRLDSIYRAAPVGIGLVSDEKWIEANEQIGKLLVVKHEDLLGDDFKKVFTSPQHYEKIRKQLILDILDHGVSTIETVWTRYDKVQIPVLMSAAFLEPNNPEKGITFTVQDISIRKVSEQEVAKTEDRYRFLFETLTEGVVYHDASGKITSVNPAAQQILGLSFDKITGMTSFDYHWRAIREDGSDFPGEEHPAMVALRTGEIVKDVIMGVYNPEKNTTRWIKINAFPIFDNGSDQPTQVYASFVDNTSEINSKKLLTETKSKLSDSLGFLKATLDTLSAHIVVLDEHGKILLANQAWIDFAKDNQGDLSRLNEGINYLEVCDLAAQQGEKEGAAFAKAIRQIIQGKRKSFELEYPCFTENKQHWFLGRVSSYWDQGNLRIVISHEEIRNQGKGDRETKDE